MDNLEYFDFFLIFGILVFLEFFEFCLGCEDYLVICKFTIFTIFYLVN